MYITTEDLALVMPETLQAFERETGIRLPTNYSMFLSEYGEGTYSNTLVVAQPDDIRLLDFVQYSFWEYDDLPGFTNKSLKHCAVVMDTVDGDMFAVGKGFNGLLLLPRNSNKTQLLTISGTWLDVMTHCMETLYGVESLSQCFIPSLPMEYSRWCGPEGGPVVKALAEKYKAAFPPDFVDGREGDAGESTLFYKGMGGYITFGFTPAREITIAWQRGKVEEPQEMLDWLAANGCEKQPERRLPWL